MNNCLNLGIFSALFLLWNGEAMAGWDISVSAVTEYGHQVDGTAQEIGEFSWETAYPNAVIYPEHWYSFPFSETTIIDSQAIGLDVQWRYTFPVSPRLELGVALGGSVFKQGMTYGISRSMIFSEWNHYTWEMDPGPYLIGRGEVEVESLQIVPQLTVSMIWKASARLRVSVSVSGGTALALYDDYDFYNAYHVVQPAFVPTYNQIMVENPPNDWIPRVSAGIGIEYALNDRWSLEFRQAFVWSDDYQLENDALGVILSERQTVQVKDQTAHQSMLGLRYRWGGVDRVPFAEDHFDGEGREFAVMVPDKPSGEWNLSVAALTEYGHQMDDGNRNIEESRRAKPPGFIIRGHWDGYPFSNTSIRSAHVAGIEVTLDRTVPLATTVDFSYGLSGSVLKEEITYDITQWVKYDGLNPFTWKVGGPPVFIGRGDFEVSSRQLIAQLYLSARWRVTERFSTFLAVQGGMAYATYDDYEFYNTYHEVVRVIPPEQQEALHSGKSDWIPRASIGLGVEYAISPNCGIFIRQSFIRKGDYTLMNEAESNGSFHRHTVHIDGQTAQQTAVGFRFKF